MHFQLNSNLRFIGHGGAAVLSLAIHVGMMQIRFSVPTPPTPPQAKPPPLTIPQQAIQVRPQPPEQSQKTSSAPPLSAAQTPPQPPAQSPPLGQTSTPPTQTDVAIAPLDQSQDEETPTKPIPTQSKDVEDPPSPETPPEGSLDLEPRNDLPPDQSLAKQWGGLISRIQAEESNFGQDHSLQDIFVLYGRDNQFELFFDASEQPKVKILNYQLFISSTPQQVWEEKVLPTLKEQDSIKISKEPIFAEGEVYRISQGEFVRYLNVLPLAPPKEVLLLEMEEAPISSEG